MEDINYNIVGIKENYQGKGKTAVEVQVHNTARSFYMTVEEIYKKNELESFSKEDCTYLAMLYVAEKEKKPELIKLYPRKKVNVTTSVLVLAIMYASFLLMSQLVGAKLATIADITFPAGLVIFPMTYIIADILTEVYGFGVSRKVIWTALGIDIMVIMFASIIVYLPSSVSWQDQSAYEAVFLSSTRVVIASITAYVFGEFLNSYTLAKLKILTKGKYLWLRSIASTAAGCLFDCIIFCSIAYFNLLDLSGLISLIITQYLMKLAYASVGIPFVQKISNYLKKKDRVDFYDYKTSFNPFSL